MNSHNKILAGIRELKELLQSCFPQSNSAGGKLDKLSGEIERLKFEIHRLEKLIEDSHVNLHGGNPALATGPVIRHDAVTTLYVKLFNSTSETKTIKVMLFNLNSCDEFLSSKQHVDHRVRFVTAGHSILESFDIGFSGFNLKEFEVEIEALDGNLRGVFAFVAGAEGNGFRLEPSNVFRHQQLISMKE